MNRHRGFYTCRTGEVLEFVHSGQNTSTFLKGIIVMVADKTVIFYKIYIPTVCYVQCSTNNVFKGLVHIAPFIYYMDIILYMKNNKKKKIHFLNSLKACIVQMYMVVNIILFIEDKK